MAQPIKIVRGTTNHINVIVTYRTGQVYEPTDGDRVIFGIKKEPLSTELLLTKVAEYNADGYHTVTLTPEDTEKLSCENYAYDVGLQTAAGDFYNVIEASPFVLMPNITRKGCAE